MVRTNNDSDSDCACKKPIFRDWLQDLYILKIQKEKKFYSSEELYRFKEREITGEMRKCFV